MSEPSDCPSPEALDRFFRGQLDPSQQEQIVAHLRTCPTCQSRMQALPTRTTPVSPLTATWAAGGQEPATIPIPLEFDSDISLLEMLDPPEDEAAVGRIGKYDVFRLLGRGGYGVVFQGFDEQLRRPIAIKVLAKDLAANQRARRRFIREARAAACINHPNVVTIYAIEEHHGTPFLVMEYVGGGSLRDRIRNGPKLGPIDLVRISAQIAQGLSAAHAHGVIHRDIKPGNVLLEDGIERLKITDFGLARVALDNVELTSRELAVGTPAYMAPEQILGREVDGRADLFALGCVIHAMVTGHSPFHGRTALEIARRVQDEHPLPLHEIDKSVPRFLSEIAERLLEKDPDKRMQTAAEAAAILNRHLMILNQTPTDKLPLALDQPLAIPETPKPQRLGSPAIVGGVVAALALVLGIWFAWRPERLPKPPDRERDGAPQAVAAGTRDVVGGGAADASARAAPARLARVTVSQQGDGDVATIGEALARVAPGGEIEILDDGVYREALTIGHDDRWRGVQITAPRGATLESDSPNSIITIHGAPELTIRGLRFRARQAQQAIVLRGDCRGVLLEDLAIHRIPNRGSTETWAAIHLRPTAAGSKEQPITLRRVKIYDTIVGIAIGEASLREPTPWWVRLEECLVVGAPTGFLFVLFAGAQHVAVERSIFSGGKCAVSVVVHDQAPFRDVTYFNNTIHNCESWIWWRIPHPDREYDYVDHPMNLERHEFKFHRNLLLDVEDTAAPLAEAVASPRFAHNVWRAAAQTATANARKTARVVEQLPVASEDPKDPDFLVPDIASLRAWIGEEAPLPGHFVPKQR